MLEQEVMDYLGREHYQRRKPDQEPRGYRNGYEPGRIDTAEWRHSGTSTTSERCNNLQLSIEGILRGNSDMLERLAVEMYARGLSTRDIEDALEDATGTRLLSRIAVSELAESLASTLFGS